MRHSSHHFYWAIAALLILFTGCAEEVALDNKEQPTSYISFVEQPNDTSVTTRSTAYNDHPLGRMVSVKDYTTTDGMPFRVELYEKEDEGDTMALSSLTRSTFYESFMVSCSVYPSTGTYTDYPCGNYFYQLSVMHNRPTAYFWPTDDYKLSFYACYPNSEFASRGPNGVEFLGSATDNGMPIYKYKIPSQYNMTELKTANITDHPGGAQGPLSVTLKNRLAKITVIVTSNTDETGWFNPSPKFENIPTEGKLQGDTWFDVGNIGGHTWENYTANAVPFPAKNASQGFGAFMFVPCELPDEAVLRLSLNYTQQYLSSYPPADREFVISLAGQTWEAGKSYTYNVTVNPDFEYDLDISGPEDYTYSGGTKQYTVTSYKTKKSTGETFPVAWTAQFSEDDGETWSDTPPSWLTAFTASDDGGTTAESYNATVTASQYLSGSATATAILRMKSAVTDVDLSDPTGIGTPQNTANCYVISAPGTYKIPLVYGNAIKNGSENSAAYSGCFTSKGESINTPYMKDNNQTPNGAEVVWKDNYSNMSNADLSIEGDYLHFNVRNTYAEGNVVIGIKENNHIIWTYHIWITPVDWSNTNATDIAGLAPTNVGWVNNGNLSYSGHQGRHCLVKFTQSEEGNLEKTITILQKEDMTVSGYSADGYCPYYQWGRFTPIIPSNNLSSLSSGTSYQHSAYNGNGSYVYNECDLIYRVGVGYTMTNKGQFISEPLIIWSVNSTSQTYYSKYMGETWKTNVKTVFDPCPVGMKVVNRTPLYDYFGSGKKYTLVDNVSFTITVSGKTLSLPVCKSITIDGTYKQRAIIGSYQRCFYWPSNRNYIIQIYEDGTSYLRTSTSNVRDGTVGLPVRGFAE